jgi:hypothetical protein
MGENMAQWRKHRHGASMKAKAAENNGVNGEKLNQQ